MPEAVRETSLEKFSTAGKKGGTGLGACSARLVAETQGGSIGMRTSSYGGATLTVTFLPVSG